MEKAQTLLENLHIRNAEALIVALQEDKRYDDNQKRLKAQAIKKKMMKDVKNGWNGVNPLLQTQQKKMATKPFSF